MFIVGDFQVYATVLWLDALRFVTNFPNEVIKVAGPYSSHGSLATIYGMNIRFGSGGEFNLNSVRGSPKVKLIYPIWPVHLTKPIATL